MTSRANDACRGRTRLFAALAALPTAALNVAPGTATAAAIARVDAPCADLRGFVTDVDPKGTNVRSGPSPDAKVLTRIPPPAQLESDRGAPVVSASLMVVGSHDGWLLVHHVVLGDGSRTTYAWDGPGWISGGLVGFTIGSRVLHVEPSTSSPVREKLYVDGYSPDSFEVARTYACRGRWAEVLLMNPVSHKPVRGWVGAVCDTQLTTCDNTDLP